MKIRSGFVSNSSSSSFLVAWDKRPEKLADVYKVIGMKEQAKLLYKWMKSQEGLFLCAPPQDNCGTCKERFRCFTGAGKISDLARLIRGGGWRDSDIEDYEDDEYNSWAIEMAQRFFDANKGKVAYCFRIGDFGEGCENEHEAEMRKGAWLGDIPCEVWE